MANVYDIGDVVRLQAIFTSLTGGLPTNIVFYLKTPSGSVQTKNFGVDPELIQDDPGRYHIDVEITEAGTWQYRFASTGSLKAACEGEFKARKSWFV